MMAGQSGRLSNLLVTAKGSTVGGAPITSASSLEKIPNST